MRPLLLQMTAGNNWCTIVADAANREEIQMRIAQIKKELSETDSVYDTEKLSERIAKLAGGVAVIKVRGFKNSLSFKIIQRSSLNGGVPMIRVGRDRHVCGHGALTSGL